MKTHKLKTHKFNLGLDGCGLGLGLSRTHDLGLVGCGLVNMTGR